MPLINRKTIKIGEASVNVRTLSAWAKTDAETVRTKLVLFLGKEAEEDGEKWLRVTDIESARLAVFVYLLVGTEAITGDLGFPWPLPSAPAPELVKVFMQLGDCLTGQQVEEWRKAIEEVDAPPAPPELRPDTDPEH